MLMAGHLDYMYYAQGNSELIGKVYGTIIHKRIVTLQVEPFYMPLLL